jgi:hypothetical protein
MQLLSRAFLAILLAHLLGDFPFQTSSLVRRKQHGSAAYVQHGAIHLATLLACIAAFAGPRLLLSARFCLGLGAYMVAHITIDILKQRLVRRSKVGDSPKLFFCDQLLHLVTVVVLAWWLVRPSWADLKSQLAWSSQTTDRVLEATVVYVAVIFAGGYVIRYLTRNLAASAAPKAETPEQLRNAGMYIGWLERLLVITALLMQSPAMVGLILTGKSIARFPELKERFAEYFLIGTLLSFTLALLGGLALLKLWYGTVSLK